MMGLFGKNKDDYSKFSFRKKKKVAMNVQEQHAELLKGAMQTPGHLMVINKGQDDEMDLCCFKGSRVKTVFTYLLVVLTCGLLRLLFHWIPHWFVYATCDPCSVEDAEKVLIKEVFKGKHNIYHVKSIKILTPDVVRQLKVDNDVLNSHVIMGGGDMPIGLSVHFENGEFRELDKLIMFNCKKVTYLWDWDKSEFVKLRGLDQDVSCQILHRNRGLTTNEQFMRRLVYGPNKITVKELSIVALLFLEVLNPFYIFQIASFILWFLDDYYYYAAAIITMSVFGISMTVRQTRKNQRKLKSTVHSSDVCTILRRCPKSDDYRTESISTELLVPGDVLVIPSHGCVMHCDAILLTGNCILNESMLTGESVPVTKTALPNVGNVVYDPKEHARHTLFCGTQVIQTRYFGTEKVLAVVVRTGFSTAKGSLVRSILYPPPVDFRFEKDSYRFVLLLAGVAGLGFVYTIITKTMRGVSARDLLVQALDLITIVVPPALPAAMTVGRFYAQIRLQKKNVFCISPRTINVSGSIDCVCFDKTGTLTEDGLDLLCVVPIMERNFRMPVKKVDVLPYNTLLCGLVSCHSLTIIDKQIVGDPLDLKMFESTKWIMEEHDVADNNKFNMIFPTVLKPPKNRDHHHNDIDEELQIGIIKEFPFSSSSQRMGVIIRKLEGQHFEYYSKGSPEMILNFVDRQSVPDDFHDVLESYTQEGYRVIALAHKELKMSYAKVNKVQRDVIEKDMTLLGLIVLENRLKPDTTPCIQALNDANVRVVMVTGDNILTALSVAKDCDIITAGQSVITVNVDNSSPPQLYYTLTSTKNMRSDYNNGVLSNSASVVSMETLESGTNTSVVKSLDSKQPKLFNNYRFAMTGKVWGVIKDYYPDLLAKLVTRGNVYARMAPEQKQQLVQELQNLGYCVAMCGDGANDCGALKAAHTGISLSEAESSVASPFTSKNANITCVLDVIKEGRAALVTSFGIFKYMAAYSLCQFVSVLILYSIDSNLTDLEFLYIDLFIISIFAFFFGKTEAYGGKLVKETPLSSLMSVSPILSLALQMFLVVLVQVGALEHLKMQSWYVKFDRSQMTDKDDVKCVENFVIFTVSGFQYIILAVVFSKGKPYRKSVFSNYGLIVSAILVTSFSVYLALDPVDFFVEHFELALPQDYNFRCYLLIYAGFNFLAAMFIEQVVVEYLVFKKLRFKFHDIDKSKRKYLAIERDINADCKWPVLSSDFKSAASPLNPPTCHTEIVIEFDSQKFDKNHVLNKIYEGADVVDELQFSSLPSEHGLLSSPSSTYKSFPTSEDLTESAVNIDELPYDGSGIFTHNLNSFHGADGGATLEMNCLENTYR